QLAVNIVDYIDEDDVSTPFNYYTALDAADPLFDVGTPNPSRAATPNNPEESPRYWVFGTELPRVVLNEAMAEFQYQAPNGGPPIAGNFPVNVWAELLNTTPKGSTQARDSQPVPLTVPAGPVVGQQPYAPYQLVVATTNPGKTGPLQPGTG